MTSATAFGEARALGNLGLARQRQGRYQEAAAYHQQALDLCREIGDRQGEACALARLGGIDLRLGRYQHAAGYLQQALALFQEIGHTAGEVRDPGQARRGLHRPRPLRASRREPSSRPWPCPAEIGDPDREADALNGLGEALLRLERRSGSR